MFESIFFNIQQFHFLFFCNILDISKSEVHERHCFLLGLFIYFLRVFEVYSSLSLSSCDVLIVYFTLVIKLNKKSQGRILKCFSLVAEPMRKAERIQVVLLVLFLKRTRKIST